MGRALVIGTAAYFALVLLLRISGKRTLSKWNSFDFAVTVAFGSVLATAFVSDSTNVAEATFSLAALVGLQYAMTWLSVRSRFVQRIIKARPTLLLYEGALRGDALRKSRVPPEEVYAAVRGNGNSGFDKIHAVVLETDGSFSIIADASDDREALHDIDGYPKPSDGKR